MPFPYPKIINRPHFDITIARLIVDAAIEDTARPFPYPKIFVGTRHCRVLTVGNFGINYRASPIKINGDQ